MMNLLIVSNNDLCRSRMAQEILNSFGRGMKIDTAGVLPGKYIPDAVGCVMEQNGMSISRKKPCDVGAYFHQSWDYVITLCQEAEEEVRSEMKGKAKHSARFYFDDIFCGGTYDEDEQMQRVMELYNTMYRELYEFFRDELYEQITPRCTCGANTYCRCE